MEEGEDGGSIGWFGAERTHFLCCLYKAGTHGSMTAAYFTIAKCIGP